MKMGQILLFSFFRGLPLGFGVLSALRYQIEQRKSGYQGTRAWRAGEQAIRQGRPLLATSILRRSELLPQVRGNSRDILFANAQIWAKIEGLNWVVGFVGILFDFCFRIWYKGMLRADPCGVRIESVRLKEPIPVLREIRPCRTGNAYTDRTFGRKQRLPTWM